MYSDTDPDLILQMLDYAIVWLPAFLAYLLLRTAAVRAVLYFMMQKAKSELSQPCEFTRGNAHRTSLNSRVYNSRFSISPTDTLQYDRWQKALKSGSSSWWRFVKAWALFTVILSFLIFYGVKHPPDLARYPILAGMLPFVFGFLLLIVIVLNGAKRYLLGYVPFVSSFLWLLMISLCALLVAPVYELNWFVCALPGVLSLLYYFTAYRRQRFKNCEDENNRLLILRVFDSDKNTAFTFGDISHFWRFIGSTITVVDPSYLRFRYSLSYPRSKLRFMRIVFVVSGLLTLISLAIGGISLLNGQVTGLGGISHQVRIELLGMFAWLILIPLALLPLIFILKRRFIASQDDLNTNLTMINNEAVSIDGVYQDISLYCHSNAWKPAISSLLDISTVILMDLRGLTPDRAGSLYELDLIIHSVALHNVVFLINDEAEQHQLTDLIRERVALASANSPNRDVSEINLNIYQPSRYEIRDTERLLAMLASATAKPGPGHFSYIIDTLSVWQRFKIIMAKPMQMWRVISEYIDMIISRPPLAYAVIPAIFLIVISLFSVRIMAVLNSLPTQTNHLTQNQTDLEPLPQPIINKPISSPVDFERPTESVEVLDHYAFTNWKGLSVRLDINTPYADSAMEMGLVKVFESIADNQAINISEINTGLFSPNLLTAIIPVKRGSITNVSSDGTTTSTKTHPKGQIRIWLKFEDSKSVNIVNNIDGELLLKLPNPAQVVQIELKNIQVSQSFTIKGFESLGLCTYKYYPDAKSLLVSFENPLPQNSKIFFLDSDGTRISATSSSSVSMGSGANKKRSFNKTFSVGSVKNISLEIIQLANMLEVRVPFYANNIPVERR
ncbi:hypothetical protein AB6T38_11625 [Aliiglaciecola sp. SL4]|uniref:hypothetical protein n=1 Tax=Aliiglaciecola sp. SL4 TaxID=3239806 RepID=UPI00355B8956